MTLCDQLTAYLIDFLADLHPVQEWQQCTQCNLPFIPEQIAWAALHVWLARFAYHVHASILTG